MAKIDRMMVGESLVGDGNEVAHIDLLIGPRGSPAETAFANALTNNKDGFTSLLAVVAPNLLTKPATVMFNKVTIKGATQAVQMFGPAQRGVAMAVADCVEDGTIPADEADNLFICVGVFIHWLAKDDKKIQDYNYQAVKESIKRAVAGSPTAAEVVAKKGERQPPVCAQLTAPGRRKAGRRRARRGRHRRAGAVAGLASRQRPPGTMPAPSSRSTAAARAGLSLAVGRHALDLHAHGGHVAELLRLDHLDAHPGRAELADQDVGDRFRRRLRATESDARPTGGASARRPRCSRWCRRCGRCRRRVHGCRPACTSITNGCVRCSSVSWMPMMVSPTKPSMKIRSRQADSSPCLADGGLDAFHWGVVFKGCSDSNVNVW